jgi:hypothetical protein
LRPSEVHATTSRVEDWEQFFVEKSRRRSEREWTERRRERTKLLIAALVIAMLLAGGIASLAIRN